MKITARDPERHHSISYPMEVGAPCFQPVPVRDHKDLMVNAARMHARQEYERIMELVAVLQRQADDIQRRLDLTEQVRAAHYSMRLYPGQRYWLAEDLRRGGTLLTLMGPGDWATAAPEHYRYICQIEWLGDSTWREVV